MGITNLEIHTGQTNQIRAQTATPTSPTPVTGEIYYDTSVGLEAIGIYGASSWIYLSTIPA